MSIETINLDADGDSYIEVDLPDYLAEAGHVARIEVYDTDGDTGLVRTNREQTVKLIEVLERFVEEHDERELAKAEAAKVKPAERVVEGRAYRVLGDDGLGHGFPNGTIVKAVEVGTSGYSALVTRDANVTTWQPGSAMFAPLGGYVCRNVPVEELAEL